jgi:hypothetical protein
VFNTSVGGNYLGNIDGTQSELQDRINHLIPWSKVETCIARLIHHLQALIDGNYCGPLGVDLMIVKKDGVNLLHPCVEINLRRTMGHAAISLRKLVAPGEQGLLCAEGFFKEQTPIYPNK